MSSSVQTIQVQSAQDLGLPLHQMLQAQVVASQKAPATLEVVFAPGVYENIAISLRDSSQRSNLEIILRGAGPEPTTIKAPIQIHAARIRLQNLVVADVSVASPVTTLKVGESLHVEGVSWVGNTRAEDVSNDPILSIQGGYRTGPKTITLKDSWFVGNVLAGGGNLVELRTVRPDIVSRLHFNNTAFVDNQCSVVVAPEFSEEVFFDQSLVHETHADAFMWIRNTVTKARFDAGLFVFGGKEGAVRYRATEWIAPDRFQPVQFSGLQPTLSGAAVRPDLRTLTESKARAGAKPDLSQLGLP